MVEAGEIVEGAGLPTGCGVEELLGRISQLIEELPWLSGMEAVIHREPSESGEESVVLNGGVRLGFSRHEAKPR